MAGAGRLKPAVKVRKTGNQSPSYDVRVVTVDISHLLFNFSHQIQLTSHLIVKRVTTSLAPSIGGRASLAPSLPGTLPPSIPRYTNAIYTAAAVPGSW